jgi:hypothetical protein
MPNQADWAFVEHIHKPTICVDCGLSELYNACREAMFANFNFGCTEPAIRQHQQGVVSDG